MSVKKRIFELDALRGVAALSVVLFHFTLGRPQLNLGFNMGCMGVDMFFVISGFVIFMSVEKSRTWKTFLWHRFARLYPAYWVCVTLTALCIVFKTHFYIEGNSDIAINLPVKYAVNMTMFQYYFRIPDIDGPYWTLIIELSFYGAMLILMIIKKVNYAEKIGFFAVLFCACFSFDIVGANPSAKMLSLIFPLINFFPLFYAGMVVYKMKFEKITNSRLFAFVLTLIIQFLMFRLCYRDAPFVPFYEYVIVLTGIYLAFFLFLIDKLGFIINPVTKWLGEISYSLYLFHQYVGTSILIPGAMKFLHFNFWVAALLALVIVLIFATMINRLVEKPAMNYLRKIYS